MLKMCGMQPSFGHPSPFFPSPRSSTRKSYCLARNSYFSLLALLRLCVISRNRSGRRWSTGGQSVPGSLRSARPSLQKAIRVSLTPPHLTTLPPPANDHTSILSPYKHTHTLRSCVQFLYINAHPPIPIPFTSLFIPLRCIAISQEAITLPYYTLSVSHH
jgi:hypothetical protein